MLISFPQFLKQNREEKGLIYTALAEMTGISKSSISRIEKGGIGINFGTSLLIAKALGFSPLSFYEQLSGKKNTIALLESKPVAVNFPSIEDVDRFEKSIKKFPEGLDKSAEYLNQIFIKMIDYKLIDGVPTPEDFKYLRSEIVKMIVNNPLSSFDLKYPDYMELEDIVQIYYEGGAILKADINAYCYRLFEYMLETYKTNPERFMILRNIPNFTQVQNIKLSIVMEADSFSPTNGEFFYLCSQAVEAEQKWDSFEKNSIGKLLLMISRWRWFLRMPNQNWLNDLLRF